MPHKGDWEDAQVWKAAEDFNMEILIGQTAPTEHGKNPLEKSFIELENENLHISAVKRSEDGLGCVVRLFNPSSETVKNRIRFNGGIAEISDKQSPIERQVHSFELPCTENRKWASVKKSRLRNFQRQSFQWIQMAGAMLKLLQNKFIH